MLGKIREEGVEALARESWKSGGLWGGVVEVVMAGEGGVGVTTSSLH